MSSSSSYHLGVGGSTQIPGNYFGLSGSDPSAFTGSPYSITAKPLKFESSLGPNLFSSSVAPKWNLGVIPSSSNPGNAFGLTFPSTMIAGLNEKPLPSFSELMSNGAPDPSKTAANLLVDIANIPPLSALSTTMDLGGRLYDGIKVVKKSGGDKKEAVICKLVKETTEVGLSTVGGLVVTGGVPLLVAEVIANPPSVVLLPIAAAALPQAYANVQHLSTFGGKYAEAVCHQLFSNGSH